jgi:hypothetical protein
VEFICARVAVESGALHLEPWEHAMPHYHKLQGPWTISPGATVGFSLSWGSDSDHGPIVPMANPRIPAAHPPPFGAAKLTTFDVAKGRGGQAQSQVFYEFKVRNDGTRSVIYDIELVDFQDLM